MSRFAFIAGGLVVAWGLVGAAPVPQGPPAREIVAKLSDPDEKVRDEASAALKDRADALPWLRRAARSKVPITAARADKLLAPHEAKRQEVVAKAIDACIRDGRIDLFMEWHHYWKPKATDDLWPVGPRAAEAGLEVYAKARSPDETKYLKQQLDATVGKRRVHDGPWVPQKTSGTWNIRTDRCDSCPNYVTFASVAAPIRLEITYFGRYFVLGSVRVINLETAFLACDGDVWNQWNDAPVGVRTGQSMVVCRGNFRGRDVGSAVVLADGDIDLSGSSIIKNCLIRASGEIRLPPNVAPVNCTIEAHAKNATAPYKFFELADLGLSVADDEEGLVVISAKADTPFGNCGLAKGDLIRAIDDAPAGHSEAFRKAVRRALVRQGDCLLAITRGDKTHDRPVFFPLPK